MMSRFKGKMQSLKPNINMSGMGKVVFFAVLIMAVLLSFLGMYWSREPDQFDVVAAAKEKQQSAVI